ncbi:hypothetical protein [Halopenitus persicus]|uniref:Uncharacterized protein n=1 Tax=Halopenitus persicus TaxID=1048396 RepID=A0A1H3FV34_9EURY|nr:hypothetical protein [Halopenitus persicus]QHS16801.1 hypothetical protein GWK26_06385 [haloarchaeon 3A1-DGR]SDX94922.1 hypothetical protein SAMN05216564_102223 [Halopenitus persicus]
MSPERSVSRLDGAIKLIGAVLLGVAVVLGAAVTAISVVGLGAISVSPVGIGTVTFGALLVVMFLLAGRKTGRDGRRGRSSTDRTA